MEPQRLVARPGMEPEPTATAPLRRGNGTHLALP